MFVLGGGFVISGMIRARWVDGYSVPGFLEFLGGGARLCGFGFEGGFVLRVFCLEGSWCELGLVVCWVYGLPVWFRLGLVCYSVLISGSGMT